MENLTRQQEARAKMWKEHTSAYEQKARIFDKELEDISKEYEHLENEKMKLAEEYGDTNVDDDDFIYINTGGREVTANRGTLTYQKGTMLEAVFS
eukprot:5653581-Ditylum_brightwellii.AAC.1